MSLVEIKTILLVMCSSRLTMRMSVARMSAIAVMIKKIEKMNNLESKIQ